MVTIFMTTSLGRGAVDATQCSKGAIAHLAAVVMGQLGAFGLGSGTLVLRADRVSSLTTLLDEIKARRAETLVERTAVESHQSIGAVRPMNRRWLACYAHSKRLSKRGSAARWRWVIRHSAWLITRFRVRASGHTAHEHTRPRKYRGAIVEVGDIVWAKNPTMMMLGKLDQRWVEVVATSTSVRTIVDRGDSLPCVANQKAAGVGAK